MPKINLQDTVDARVWAREFIRVINNPTVVIDEDFMLGWFANAIAAGKNNWQITLANAMYSQKESD